MCIRDRLKVKEYTDYIQPNKDTASGAVDANYFQHITYLENSNAKNGTDLVSAGLIHYEPFAVYAGTSSDLNAIADGATIAIPNDPTNEGRALLLLQDLGPVSYTHLQHRRADHRRRGARPSVSGRLPYERERVQRA